MKAVISNFSIFKTLFSSKTLPVILFFFIFYTSCKIFYSENSVKIPDNADTFRNELVELSEKYIGTRYRYGGVNPNMGFDCSGFTRYIYKKKNIILPHSSLAQSKLGKRIKIKNIRKGDLVFFKNNGKIDHVAMVISRTEGHLIVVHSTTSSGVKKEDIFNSEYWKKKLTFAIDVMSN